jgi:hypothetical protein
MIEAHRLAGFVAAHGIWSVSDGETLISIYAYNSENGDQVINRLIGEKLEEIVATAREKLNQNESNANDAVLIFDGRIPIEDKKYDALIIEIRSYFSPDSRTTIAVPYTPKSEFSSFKVHKPKILQWESCDDFDIETCVNAFFEGVDSHETAAEIWNQAIDQSI